MAIAPTLTACIALETRYRRALRPSARKRPKASASIPGAGIGGWISAVPAVLAGVALARWHAFAVLPVLVVALDRARAAVTSRRGIRLTMGMRCVAVLWAGQPWLLARGDALHLLCDVNALVFAGPLRGLSAKQQHAHACLDGLAPAVELRDTAHDLVAARVRNGHRLLRPGGVLAQHRHDLPIGPDRGDGEADHQRGDDQQHDQELSEQDGAGDLGERMQPVRRLRISDNHRAPPSAPARARSRRAAAAAARRAFSPRPCPGSPRRPRPRRRACRRCAPPDSRRRLSPSWRPRAPRWRWS